MVNLMQDSQHPVLLLLHRREGGLHPLEKLEYFPRVRAVASHCPLLWASLVGLLPSSCSYRPSQGLNCPSKG